MSNKYKDVVSLFTDLARKHQVSVNDIELSIQGEEIVICRFNGYSEDTTELERININQ
jgi:hypothetical protein